MEYTTAEEVPVPAVGSEGEQSTGWEMVAEEVAGVIVLQVKEEDDTMAPTLDVNELQKSESMMEELRLSELGGGPGTQESLAHPPAH